MDLEKAFQERLDEIEEYLSLLRAIDKQIQLSGMPRLAGTNTPVTVLQVRMLYASVYLQLYNLVESTITNCLDAVCEAINNTWRPEDLSIELQREWVRFYARTHTPLEYEKRLEETVNLLNYILHAERVLDFKVDKGAGGSWDEVAIAKICERLGFNLLIDKELYSEIKRRVYNDRGALDYIKTLRNELAHGSLSFAACGANTTIGELERLIDLTSRYLKEVVKRFTKAMQAHEFLNPSTHSKS